jgi:two-component system, cell cycle response regulator DivK
VTKVLVVEDEPDNARMIARTLRMRGYEVVLAADGKTAVDMAGSQQPDVILMDLLLAGGMGGSEATRQIKSAATTHSIPVIMLSASHLASFQTEAFEAGADEVDTKPVEFDRLISKMEAIIQHA